MKRESIIPKSQNSLINRFVNDQDTCDKSKEVYRSNITQFFSWVYRSGYDVSKLERVDVLNYKKFLERTQKSPYTVDGYITAVRKYFAWASNNNLFPNIAEGIRNPKKPRSLGKIPLNMDQATNLLNIVKTDNLIGMRDYTIISLMINNGLRCSEVAGIQVEDLSTINDEHVIYIKGKGHTSKDNYVFVTDEVYDSIAKFLEYSGVGDRSDPLFKSYSRSCIDRQLTGKSISKIVKSYLKSIGLDDKRFTAHSLRHTAACLLIQSGVDVYDVQLYLRHSSPNVTQIYTRMIEEQKRLSNVSGKKINELFKGVSKVWEMKEKPLKNQSKHQFIED